MILPQIEIARAHWVLGALFLVVILEEYLPRTASAGAAQGSRSLVVPWALLIAGFGVWATSVFADVVHDMYIHSLWGDLVFAGGALELARRRGALPARWAELVLPVVFLGCGVLFLAHEWIDPSARGVRWHEAMGCLLIAGGGADLARRRRARRSAGGVPSLSLTALALLPLTAFALALIAIPVASAS